MDRHEIEASSVGPATMEAVGVATGPQPGASTRTALRQGALILASALLLGISFPPWRFQALAWVALAPLFVALRRARPVAALGLIWAWMLVFCYVIGDWLPRAVSLYYQQPALVGAAFYIGVISTMGAPYCMLFSLMYRALARRGPPSPLLVAAAWATAELGRGRLFTGTPFFIGNPWGVLGYSQVGAAPVVQIASATGIYGVSFIIAAVNAALAEAWLARAPAGQALRGIARGAVPAALALVYGFTALRGARSAAGVETRVAIVQANLDLGSTWHSEFYGRNLDVYLRLTREVIVAARPRIVFWPEAAMTFFLEEEPLYRNTIAGVLGMERAELVAGGPRRVEGGREPRHFNSIYLLSPDGEIRAHYDKEYLVPFAEYFPLRRLDFLRRRFERVRVFTPGQATAPLPTAAGPAGIVICNEAMLPEVVGARVAAGAAYLLNPSNDSWLDDRKYSALQFDIVAMRAVEQRRWLVRASTSGPSAIVDPWGRVAVQTLPLTRDTAVGTIRARTGRSIYGRLGDTFAFACAASVGVALRPRRGC